MQGDVLISTILPFCLFLIMLGMGMSLVVGDFTRVLLQPKAFVVGFLAQMLVLPLLAFLIVSFFEVDPLLAVGLMILAFCPGGTTSNMFSFLAKGDLALSVSLTALVSVIAPFTIPFLANLSMEYFLGDNSKFQLPFIETVTRLLVITVVPIALGMVINHFQPNITKLLDKPFKILSIIFLLFISVMLTLKNLDNLVNYVSQVGIPAVLLNISALIVALGIALAFRLNQSQVVTISFEVGVQNSVTALLITNTILKSDVMTISPAVYGLFMLMIAAVWGVLLSFFLNKKAASTS